ncbi:MAG: nucleotidyltransferase family protein [Cytophagales bacterium]|nr:nucleotidyltransferase family protein [Cytophagales bacterium]
MAKVSAIVLAAGLSRRMGMENKMGLMYQGKPIVHHVIDQLTKSTVFETIIVTSEVSQDLFPNHDIILNEHYQTGMTSSIQAGVRAASAHTEGYMICLGDQPLIQTEDYDHIVNAFSENFRDNPSSIIAPTYGGKKGNPVVFPFTFKEVILNHEEPEGCKSIIQSNKQHVHAIEMSTNHVLQDIDTPTDYKQISSS